MSRLFGTDGVRGVANAEPLTPELVCRLGRASASLLAERAGGASPAVVVGRDTRISGPLLESALVAGILSSGVDVLLAGVMPTPGVALLTSALGAVGGFVLSASHNPFADNGIKLFSARGDKLPDEWESEIEARLSGEDRAARPTGAALGRCRLVRDAERRYLDLLGSGVARELDLSGLRLVLDCAHGATYRVAPRLFRQLGARVACIGVRPDGVNINRASGALHPGRLQARVLAESAALGLAFDGDGDRLIAVDERGEVRDGDFVLAICARALVARGGLRGGTVVSTVMANLGLERALAEAGVGLVRAPVGDRHVLEAMRRVGANLGGEQSGHTIFLDSAPTGDGLVSALQLLRACAETGQSLATLSAPITRFPQVLLNVPVRSKPRLEELPGLGSLLRQRERELAGHGRILVRYSGTEPVARVMVEGDDQMAIDTVARELADAIAAEIGVSP